MQTSKYIPNCFIHPTKILLISRSLYGQLSAVLLLSLMDWNDAEINQSNNQLINYTFLNSWKYNQSYTRETNFCICIIAIINQLANSR